MTGVIINIQNTTLLIVTFILPSFYTSTRITYWNIYTHYPVHNIGRYQLTSFARNHSLKVLIRMHTINYQLTTSLNKTFHLHFCRKRMKLQHFRKSIGIDWNASQTLAIHDFTFLLWKTGVLLHSLSASPH